MSARDPERYAPRLVPAGAVLAVVGGCAGGWLGLLLAGVGLLLLLTACVSRDDGLLLLGPFVRSELVRASRTRRLALWRTLYAAGTAGMATLCFLPALRQPVIDPRALPALAETFFVAFAVVQFLYLAYLTAAVIAPIVAEEREARRWDFLLATDLRAREILLGKAVGRLPLLLDPVLASLPILALLPLFGGVSPRLVVLVGVGTLAMMLGVAGLSFFYSVFSPTGRVAVGRVIGLVMMYFALSSLLAGCCCVPVMSVPLSALPAPLAAVLELSPIGYTDVILAVSAGNPLAAVILAVRGVGTPSGGFEDALAAAVRRFAAFQLGVFFLFGLMAIVRLRRAAPWRAPGKPPPERAAKTRPKRPVELPPIGDYPVYWWERYGALARTQLAFVAYPTLRHYAILWLVCVALFAAARAISAVMPKWAMSEALTVLVPAVLCLGSWGLILGPALSAARSVAQERAADTLDALRLTALTSRDILFQKWLGCVATELPPLKQMAVLAAAGVATGYLHPLALLGMLIELPVYMGASAAIGLVFSVRAANPSQATRNLILSSVVVLGGLVFLASQLPGRLSMFALPAILPPAGITITLFVSEASRGTTTDTVVGEAVAIVMGMLLYAVCGRLLWQSAVRRFEWERHSE
jgi:hypothetical protein